MDNKTEEVKMSKGRNIAKILMVLHSIIRIVTGSNNGLCICYNDKVKHSKFTVTPITNIGVGFEFPDGYVDNNIEDIDLRIADAINKMSESDIGEFHEWLQWFDKTLAEKANKYSLKLFKQIKKNLKNGKYTFVCNSEEIENKFKTIQMGSSVDIEFIMKIDELGINKVENFENLHPFYKLYFVDIFYSQELKNYIKK